VLQESEEDRGASCGPVRGVMWVRSADLGAACGRVDRQRSLSREGRLIACCHQVGASSSEPGRIWRCGANLRGLSACKVYPRESGQAGRKKGLWQGMVRSKMGAEEKQRGGVRVAAERSCEGDI
jgi:hypothetical protein